MKPCVWEKDHELHTCVCIYNVLLCTLHNGPPAKVKCMQNFFR